VPETNQPVGAEVSDTDLVFVPAHPRVKAAGSDVVFEVRVLESGKAAGIAFTSMRELVEALGEAQPWVAIPIGRFRELMGGAGVGDIVINPSVPQDAVRWKPDDVQEFIAGGRA
jgi:hypothetical protein